MKPVDQRKIDAGTGDCMTACLASLLDLPYEAVPLFREIEADGSEQWFSVLWKFLKDNGYSFTGTWYHSVQLTTGPEIHPFEELRERSNGVNGLFLAGGPSPRFPGVSHAVLIDGYGNLVHDPHPSRQGVNPIEDVWMIEPLAQSEGKEGSRG